MSSKGRHRGGGGRHSCHKPRRCYNCGKKGHLAYQCRSPRPDQTNRGSNQENQSRINDRRFFDKLTRSEDSSITSVEDAIRLLKASLSFAATEGGPALLYRLNENSGSSALRKCLEYITSPPLFEEGFLPLLERLAQPDLDKPVYNVPMDSVISNLYKLPFLLPSIKSLAPEWIERGSNDKRTVLAWFLAKISLNDNDARTNCDLLYIAEQLTNVGCGDYLKTILGDNLVTEVSLFHIRDSQMETPGGRHDNDKGDFRSISIVPTRQEWLSDADPYLPTPTCDEQTTEASLLDRHFRLLREDILGPSRELHDDPKKKHRDIFYNTLPVSVESGVVYDDHAERIFYESDPCIMFEFQMPKWFRVNSFKTDEEKKSYWEKNRRILPRDALVCLERKNCQNIWEPVRFGTIVCRKIDDLISERPAIGIAFQSEKDWDDTLLELADRSSPPTRLFIVSADLFAYQPILRGLQMMIEIPFKHEIVSAKPSLAVEEATIEIPEKLKTKVDTLNPDQRAALDAALKDRVALIQGPPGTGKTFLGVLLAQIFLSSTPHSILVVTFTNHALDDVLEALLDAGVKNIVRLGGRSRSKRLSQFNLRELSMSDGVQLSREQSRRRVELQQEIECIGAEVRKLSAQMKIEAGKMPWSMIEDHLKINDPDSYKQLSVPEDIFRGRRTAGDKKIPESYLWHCWLNNERPSQRLEWRAQGIPSVLLEARAQGALWRLNRAERGSKIYEWQQEIFENIRSSVILALKRIKRAHEELKDLKQINDAHILSDARVIGCTTTKAAMCKSLLDSVKPGIIVVEEAAEILEAHVLTSLHPGVKRLVMIGDHKQLRPKCQYYPLTCESNRGFNLNCSLFERLANAHPISTLGMQHRMHPEISSIPKLITYHELQDAQKTSSHSEVRGIASRVVFVNHDVPEEDQSVDILESVSKTNFHESDMVVQIVKYILKQGYSPKDIVVLTPYLGQMLKLRSDLVKHLDVFLDEKDIGDARDQLYGDDTFMKEIVAASRSNQHSESNCSIRVATIDNFQGEESKIVIASLVRSNSSGHIGFLKEPERVNVLLSRARDCEIIIGNRMTFEQAKGSFDPLKGGALWGQIFEHLDKGLT